MDEIGKFKRVQAKINKIQTKYSENYINFLCSGGNSEKSVDVFNGLNWYCQGRYCSSIYEWKCSVPKDTCHWVENWNILNICVISKKNAILEYISSQNESLTSEKIGKITRKLV